MDTQGAFSCNSTLVDCTTLFALSVLLSSIQIYNLSSDITEHDLERLQVHDLIYPHAVRRNHIFIAVYLFVKFGMTLCYLVTLVVHQQNLTVCLRIYAIFGPQ